MSADKKDDKPKHDIESFPCASCGIVFGISREVTKNWKENHHKFVCPNGHTLSWDGPTEQDKELKALKEKVKLLEEELDESKKEAKALRASVENLQQELEIWKPSSESAA